MGLYDITTGARLLTPDNVCGWEIMIAIQRKLHPRTYDKIINTIDKALDQLVKESIMKGGKLVWAKTASLIGYKSKQPTDAINHIWEMIDANFGTHKLNYQAVGSLVCYCIAKRDEAHWLLDKTESDEIDEVTGKLIKYSTYWINENFTPPEEMSLNALVGKFNVRR